MDPDKTFSTLKKIFKISAFLVILLVILVFTWFALSRWDYYHANREFDKYNNNPQYGGEQLKHLNLQVDALDLPTQHRQKEDTGRFCRIEWEGWGKVTSCHVGRVFVYKIANTIEGLSFLSELIGSIEQHGFPMDKASYSAYRKLVLEDLAQGHLFPKYYKDRDGKMYNVPYEINSQIGEYGKGRIELKLHVFNKDTNPIHYEADSYSGSISKYELSFLSEETIAQTGDDISVVIVIKEAYFRSTDSFIRRTLEKIGIPLL